MQMVSYGLREKLYSGRGRPVTMRRCVRYKVSRLLVFRIIYLDF